MTGTITSTLLTIGLNSIALEPPTAPVFLCTRGYSGCEDASECQMTGYIAPNGVCFVPCVEYPECLNTN